MHALGRFLMLWTKEAPGPQLLSLRSTACELQLLSLCAATTEAHMPRTCAAQPEAPLQREARAPQAGSRPCAPELGKPTKKHETQRSQEQINKETQELSLALFLPCEETMKRCPHQNPAMPVL